MLFDDMKKNVLRFPNYNIVASDIDRNILEKALIGHYCEEQLKEIPLEYKYKYFIKAQNRFLVKYLLSNSIKNQVEFVNEDVTRGHLKSTKYDIIFCRYFLIYTNKSLRYKILSLISNQLAKGGLLFLGKTETLFKIESDFKIIDSKNHIYMKKY